jgi:two-component system chemotaxis response regulator CheY
VVPRPDAARGVTAACFNHRAFGRHLDTLTIAVIDNRRPTLSLMRAMLAAIGTGRIETYESPTEAIDAMGKDVPDIVVAAASMQPVAGPALVKSMRRASAGPLSLVPAMIMSVRAKSALVEQSLRAGAHQVLVLPITASTLYRRLDWLINDDRPFELSGKHYVLAGTEERLSLSFQRPVYVPTQPNLSSPAAAPTPESGRDLAKKARAAPR